MEEGATAAPTAEEEKEEEAKPKYRIHPLTDEDDPGGKILRESLEDDLGDFDIEEAR